MIASMPNVSTSCGFFPLGSDLKIHTYCIDEESLPSTSRDPLRPISVSTVWRNEWETLAAGRGNGVLPAAWYLARNFAGMRLAELGSAASDYCLFESRQLTSGLRPGSRIQNIPTELRPVGFYNVALPSFVLQLHRFLERLHNGR